MFWFEVHSQRAVEAYKQCLQEAQKLGGKVMAGGEEYKHPDEGLKGGFWLQPAIVFYGAAHPETMEEETFAPILRKYKFISLAE